MPELPEVETVVRRLKPIEGQIIKKVQILDDRLRFPVPKILKKVLSNQKISRVKRRAKYILIELENNRVWLSHLGMTGRFFLRQAGSQNAREKYLILEAQLDNGFLLDFTDVRRLGFMDYGLASENQFLQELGPEPLSRDFTAKYLHQQNQKRNTSIKQVLMNQKIIAGLGNIYVNEVLFDARIHPSKMANTLTDQQSSTLATSIKKVLRRAIKKGGSTISDFLDSDGRSGNYQKEFQVYSNHQCKHCSEPITKISQNGRASYFCIECQEL